MFDFPATPVLNQTYTSAGIVWQYNGYGWVAQAGNIGPVGPAGPTGPQGDPGIPGPTGGVTIEVSDTEPVNPADKSLWFKSNAGALWLRYRDTDGVQWLQVNSNLILPPQDGNEYVMCNGLWRLKSQSFVLDGLSTVAVPCPVGARFVKFQGSVNQVGTVAMACIFRASLDGTNFMGAANDYSHSGFIHYGAGTTVAGLTGAYGNAYLTYNGTISATLAHVFDGRVSLLRNAGGRWDINCVGSVYGASGWATNVSRIEVMETNAGANVAMKAIQLGIITGVAAGASTIDVEWVY